MENVIQSTRGKKEEREMEILFSYLDKGIDDVKAGRIYTVDEAFAIIEERLKK